MLFLVFDFALNRVAFFELGPERVSIFICYILKYGQDIRPFAAHTYAV